MTGSGAWQRAASRVSAPDPEAQEAARRRHERLLKPSRALGELEEIGVRLAGMAGTCPPPDPHPAALVVFAGDHGVHARGVTPWPRAVTAAMTTAIADGRATACALARHAGIGWTVVDVGVAGEVGEHPRLVDRRIRAGTRDLTVEPAMTGDEVAAALDAGVEAAEDALAGGARCLVGGEMGIANTTPSAALVAVLLDLDPDEVTGRGTGVDDATLAAKVRTVGRGVERTRDAGRARGDGSTGSTGSTGRTVDPLAALASVGGLEIAALAGLMIGGAAARVPVLVDGFVAGAAACAADALAPGTARWMIAGHRSVERGAAAVLDHLGLVPVLDLRMRLGEGTGAVLALHQVRAAAAVLRETGTLDDLDL